MEKQECPICRKTGLKNLKLHILRAHPTEEATMATKQPQLNQLLGLAKNVGVDVDGEKLLEELSLVMISRYPQIDEVALMEKIAIRVETRVATKLSDVLEAVKVSADGSKPDTESIIKGVANLLQPQIIEATRQASEAVFTANSQGLLRQLEEKLKQQAVDVPTPEQPLGNMSAGGLIQALLANSDGIAKLIQAFRPPQSTDAKIAEQLGLMLRYHKILGSLEQGKGNIDEIESLISSKKQ